MTTFVSEVTEAMKTKARSLGTSEWNIATVDLGSHLYEHITFMSKKELKAFCKAHGYRLVSFKRMKV